MWNSIYNLMAVLSLVCEVVLYKYAQYGLFAGKFFLIATIFFYVTLGILLIWCLFLHNGIKLAYTQLEGQDEYKLNVMKLVVNKPKRIWVVPVFIVGAIFGFVFLDTKYISFCIAMLLNGILLETTVVSYGRSLSKQIDLALKKLVKSESKTKPVALPRTCLICAKLKVIQYGEAADDFDVACEDGKDTDENFQYDTVRDCCVPDMFEVANFDAHMQKLLEQDALTRDRKFTQAQKYLEDTYGKSK